jgi:hypothetical protein
LLQTSIQSVLELHVLLLMRETQSTEWSVDALAEQLDLDPGALAGLLRGLTRRGLLQTHGGGVQRTFCFEPHPPAFAETVERLAVLYIEHRAALVSLIENRPPMPLRHFSEAFRVLDDE